MYLTIPQAVFRQALSQVVHLSGGKSQLPILKHVLLSASWGEACLRASNEETSICYRMPAEVQASGSVLLPAKVLAEFVSDLASAPLTLAAPAPKDASKVLLQCQQARALFNQAALSCDEFPSLPSLADEGAEALFLLDCELLKELINQVAFAAAEDLSRPALGGVQVIIAKGQATFAAADAFRMAMRSIPVPNVHLTRELLIPASALLVLGRLLPDVGAIQVAVVGGQILFHTEQMDVSTRLMHEAFPNVRAALPTASPTRVVTSIASLAAALRLMAPFARASGHKLRVSVMGTSDQEPAGLRLLATAPDLGENEMKLAATVVGPDVSLLVNLSFLSELLAVVPGQEVALEVSGAQRPILVRPVVPIDAVSVVMTMYDQKASVASPAPRAASTAHS